MKPRMEANTPTSGVIGIDIGKGYFTLSGAPPTGRLRSGGGSLYCALSVGVGTSRRG